MVSRCQCSCQISSRLYSIALEFAVLQWSSFIVFFFVFFFSSVVSHDSCVAALQ